MKISVYKYHSVAAFLRDSYNEKRKANERFSLRAWAKQLGLKSPTSLHAVIQGQRKIPLNYHEGLVSSLKLSDEESYYLLVLISYEHAKNDLQKLSFLEKLQVLRKYKNLSMHELANFEFLSDPFYTCLVEMTDLKDFQSEVSWIQKNNRITKDANQIKCVLSNLLEEGYLQSNEDRVFKAHTHTTNVHDLANLGSQKYHRNTSLLAAESVQVQSVDEREFNSYSMNIESKNLDKIKASMREYVKRFIAEFEAPAGEGDSTYQLNLQFFSLTEKL